MRVYLELSGGYGGLFAGKPLTAEAADDDLTDHERTSLSALAAGGRAERGARVPAALGGAAPDAFTYRLTVASGGGKQTVTYNDLTLPSELRPLVERLRKRAISERGG